MLKLFNYFQPLARLEQQRQRLLATSPALPGSLPEPLLTLLRDPLPAADTRISELDYLVLDLETSGLDPERDHILSLGYLELSQGTLCLQSAETTYVQAHDKVKAETAVINHIVPQMLIDAHALDDAMLKLFARMQGKVLLVHGSNVERRFIQRYLQQRYQLTDLPLIWFDTLLMEKSLFSNRQLQQQGDYRLAAVRSRHNLPAYPGHGALVDALATGELFIALCKKLFGPDQPTLAQFYRGRNLPANI